MNLLLEVLGLKCKSKFLFIILLIFREVEKQESDNDNDNEYSMMRERGYSKIFIKSLLLTKINENTKSCINANLKMIMDSENFSEYSKYFSFYDKSFEQLSILKNKANLKINMKSIFKSKINNSIKSEYEQYINYFKNLYKMIPSENNNIIFNDQRPEYRISGDEEYMSQAKGNVLKKTKEILRNKIKSENFGTVLYFENLEQNFPTKEFRILLKDQKERIVRISLTLINRFIKSGLLFEKNILSQELEKLIKDKYYNNILVSNDFDDDDDNAFSGFGMGFFGRSNFFNKKKNKVKNVVLESLKERILECYIDQSKILNFFNKLISLNIEKKTFFTLFLQFDHLLTHPK